MLELNKSLNFTDPVHRLFLERGGKLSLERYGINPVIRQPNLNNEEAELLRKITVLRDIIDDQKKVWFGTSSTITTRALYTTGAFIVGLSGAVQADNYRVERIVKIIEETNMSMAELIVGAIRCPRTNDRNLAKKMRDVASHTRNCLKNGWLEVFDDLLMLCEGSNVDQFTHFVTRSRSDIMALLRDRREQTRIVELENDIVDNEVVAEGSPPLLEGMHI